MSKVITPILFVLIAIGLFFSYLSPAWDVLLAYQAQADRLDASIEKTKGLLEIHNTLLGQYSSISSENIARINKILPDTIDVVRMIIDIDALATKHNLSINSFDIPDLEAEATKTTNKKNTKAPASGNEKVGSAVLTIECNGDYPNFKEFIAEIENSLSLMDIVTLDVEAPDLTKPGEVKGITYTIGLQTYWLK